MASTMANQTSNSDYFASLDESAKIWYREKWAMRGNIPDPYLTMEKGDKGLEWSKMPEVQCPDI